MYVRTFFMHFCKEEKIKMYELQTILCFLISLIFSLLLIFFVRTKILGKKNISSFSKSSPRPPSTTDYGGHDHVIVPKSYPIIGSYIAFNRKDRLNFITDILRSSPTNTFILHRPLGGGRHILTANPANVEHILKTQFSNYPKGELFRSVLEDLLGHGIFNVDGHDWKYQRQIASHEFSTKSLRKFVEKVVDSELFGRLIPLLSKAAIDKTVALDLQDVLQRFGFDNICKIAFGYDPGCLSINLPDSPFANAYDEAVTISGRRFRSLFPIGWKMKRALGIGSDQKRLKEAVRGVRGFALEIVRRKKHEIMNDDINNPLSRADDDNEQSNNKDEDLLSRFLISSDTSSRQNYNYNLDEKLVVDIVISFILAGRDSTSAALTWFFWLLSNNPRVEEEILRELMSIDKIQEHEDDQYPATSSSRSAYEEVKDLVYTHAAICESMRLYPPVPANSKQAVCDDVLPDGTVVKKGMKVTYFPYTMGRLEKLWGKDWAEFRPERWLQQVELQKVDQVNNDGMLRQTRFVPRDPYTYPVFQAGPRICLGKEMAFLQMKRIVSVVLKKFKLVPAVEEGFQPIFLFNATSKMKGGFPVRFERRLDYSNRSFTS